MNSTINTFYNQGGWPGPDWSIPHNGLNTFQETLSLAQQKGIQWIQAATWNDYGEGTMIEPTREFGNGFLNILQSSLGVPYGNTELNLIKEYYFARKNNEGNKAVNEKLDLVYEALNSLQPEKAADLMKKL